jgi:hypothetical protein
MRCLSNAGRGNSGARIDIADYRMLNSWNCVGNEFSEYEKKGGQQGGI